MILNFSVIEVIESNVIQYNQMKLRDSIEMKGKLMIL